jgi:hypothetical protein
LNNHISKKTQQSSEMPQCSVGNKCSCPTAPLDGRHLCAICNKQLHGPCGVFNGDESAITFCNQCFSCPGPIEELTFLSPSPNVGGAVTLTEQFAIASAKDVDAKKVGWEDIVPGVKAVKWARPLRRSPTGSESSLKFSGKSTLAASITALIEERCKSRELSLVQRDPYVSQLTKEKLEMQVSRNLEDNVNCLIEVKRKLEVETNPGIVKVRKKYEKHLKEVIDMTSSSENEEE